MRIKKYQSSKYNTDVRRIIKVSDAYTLQDLCEMDDNDRAALLRFYAPDKVPRYQCLKAKQGDFDAFNGSFGFYVG